MSNEQIIRKNEECFLILKERFGNGNPTQSLSHALSLYDGDIRILCQRTFDLFDALKCAGRNFSRLYDLTILGVLAGEGRDINEIVCDILDVDDYLAKQKGYDYFATTLTVSPLKNCQLINSIGEKLQEQIGVNYLPSDFKKKGGYLRSIELSKKHSLYRQNYCGCEFSKDKNPI